MTVRISLLHLVNEFAYSSTNYRLLNLVRGLNRDRYHLHVGCVKRVGGPMVEQYSSAGAQIVNMAIRSGDAWLKFGSMLEIARYVRHHNIHIVHTHNLRADVVGGLAVRLLRQRPVLISTKGNAGYSPSQKAWLARNFLYWPAMYLPDRVITVSKVLCRDVTTRLRFNPDRIAAIHTGIELSRFDQPHARDAARAQFGLHPDTYLLTYSGRLVTGKGLDDLLCAFQQLVAWQPNARLLIVGDGPLLESLKKLANDLGIIKQVVFLGFRLDIPAVLAATDVFVQPSLTEGLPQSVMEAMAAGKSVVATAVGGNLELIESGVTGVLVPPRDPTALANALRSVLDNTAARLDLGRSAQAYVRRHFTIRHMVDEYDVLYQHLTANRI